MKLNWQIQKFGILMTLLTPIPEKKSFLRKVYIYTQNGQSIDYVNFLASQSGQPYLVATLLALAVKQMLNELN